MTRPLHSAETDVGAGSPPANVLFTAVDETLTYVFKEAGAEAIYDFLEKKCQLQRNEIPLRPGVFSKSLKMLLGSAAPVIESMIVENLYLKFGLEFEKKAGYEFVDYLVELRR